MNCLAFGHMNSTLHHIPNPPSRPSDERWYAISYYELSGRNQHKLLFTCFLSRKWSVDGWERKIIELNRFSVKLEPFPLLMTAYGVGMAFGVRWIYVCKYLLNWCT